MTNDRPSPFIPMTVQNNRKKNQKKNLKLAYLSILIVRALENNLKKEDQNENKKD
jgi:uncharacterized protein Veg